ncbi:hypothetical protein HDE_10313 [Halotydeus destructor]|nr:hypothetical protein HDE_10313 [Halotydeus destructor]
MKFISVFFKKCFDMVTYRKGTERNWQPVRPPLARPATRYLRPELNWQPIRRLSSFQAQDKTSRWAKAIFFIFALTCSGCCFYQCFQILNLFFQYPTVVDVKSVLSNLTIPGITLCNGNTITLTNLKKYTANMADLKAKEFTEDYKALEAKGEKGKKELQDLIDKYVRIILEAPISDTVNNGPSFAQYVNNETLACAFDEKGNTNVTCGYLVNPLTTSQQIGNCFTLFHESKGFKIEEVSVEPGYGQSPIIYGNQSLRVEVADQPFQPNEVLRMVLNFEPDEYTILDAPVFGTISIHDPSESPDTRKRRFYLYPGYYYEFYVTKKETILLEAPYESRCFDYVRQNQREYDQGRKKGVHPYLDAPLSRDDCRIGCLAKRTLLKCQCWPPEIPYLQGYEQNVTIKVNDKEQNVNFAFIETCDWVKLAKKRSLNLSAVYDDCFAMYDSLCNEICRQDCLITDFDVRIQNTAWPSKEKIVC